MNPLLAIGPLIVSIGVLAGPFRAVATTINKTGNQPIIQPGSQPTGPLKTKETSPNLNKELKSDPKFKEAVPLGMKKPK